MIEFEIGDKIQWTLIKTEETSNAAVTPLEAVLILFILFLIFYSLSAD